MASQVPYNPVPSVAPEDRPIPSQQINAPPDAFGAATAAATEHLGQVSSQVGDELFARALSMQQLKQQADADAASTEYQKGVGQLYADFKSKAGKDPIEDLPAFQERLSKLREDTASTLSSPYAIQAFNQQSRSLEGRTNMAAAAHAGEQLKAYSVGTLLDQSEASANHALANPSDHVGIQEAYAHNAHTATYTAQAMGRDQAYADNQELKLNTNLTSKWVSGIASTNPLQAQEILEQAKKAGKVDSDTYDKLSNQVQSQILNKTTTTEAANIFNDPANKDKSAAELQDIAAARAESLKPGDAVFKDTLTNKIEALRGKQAQIKRADEFDRIDTLRGAVMGVGMSDGKLPTEFSELSPKAQAAYTNASDKTQGAINAALARNAVHGGYSATPQNIAEYHQLRGMLVDPNMSADDRVKALQMDMIGLQMPAENAQKLYDLQRKLRNNDNKGVYIQHAMGLMGPTLLDETIGINKKTNPDGYNKFIGAFDEALTLKADELKRSPNDKEIKEIGASLLQKISVPGMFYGTNDEQLYGIKPTDKYTKMAKDLAASRGLPEPSPEQIRRMYVADRQRELAKTQATLWGKNPQRVTPGTDQ